MNEEEGLPIWKLFEQDTGIKVEYVRGSDSQMIGRILIENRGGRPAWDVVAVTSVQRLPSALLAEYEPPQAQISSPPRAIRAGAGMASRRTTTCRPTTPGW